MHLSLRSAALFVLLVSIMSLAAGARAQVQVKPWFLVIVDTSGSMQDNCTNGATNWPTCNNCGGGCATTANSCGQSHTRINDAKCALRNILNSTGDAEFALMQFRHPCRLDCASQAGGNASTCDADLSVGISASNYSLLTWVDGTCQGNCTGQTTQEVYAYGNTPIGQSLVRAKEYFSGTLTGQTSPTATDTYAGCRPLAVIMMTDGDENCGGSGTTAATALRTTTIPTLSGNKVADIKTYAVGFGLTPGYAAIENLATSGGTDAPGAFKGFYAQNEEGLSAALNQIITNSQLSERCDGRDNDCDTRIDEDNAKFCDVHGIRTANPQVPNPANPATLIDQALVDPRVPACAGATCSAVSGVQGNASCAAPEWVLSSTCSPANVLCSSPGELCDGQDDDCDGKVDEAAPPIAPSNEICGDRVDNDCDALIDEGCNGCIAQPEVCNNLSDDCDANIDEGLTRACGTDVGECAVGSESCSAGLWIGCNATVAITETCNNKDDDCDGVIDGITMTCGVSNVGLCRLGVRTCLTGSFGACVGNVDPAPELCDGFDNDCDNAPNDDGSSDSRVGVSCGNNTGVCTGGTTACQAGEVKCVGGTTGTTEQCDALDNDCDGNIDEGVAATDIRVNQPCIAPGGVVTYGPVMAQGQCRLGSTVCSSGGLICPGYVGPSPELCDNIDQDCNGDPVNGVAMTDPRIGASCGTSVGECDPGQIICSAGTLVCSAAPAGSETCNSKDDDCDGLTDENLPLVPVVCGSSSQGECKTGLQACIGGVFVCQGEVTPSPEICDGLDNNCNGAVDEGNPGAGRSCGSSIGECLPGTTVCTNGSVLCPDATGPSLETCDGKDNDCDGLTDEGNPQGGAACDTDSNGSVLLGSCRTALDPTDAQQPRDQACGECRFGSIVCSSGNLSCVGTVGPRAEVCDGLDNDCDSPCVLDNSDPQHPVRKCPVDPCQLPKTDPGYLDCDAKVDEGVAQTDPNVGVLCVGGSGECKQGTEACVGGTLTCVGGQNGVAEICNNKDDDCDTQIDEAFTLGAPCGAAIGECKQGVYVCDPVTGGMACQNQTKPTPELCDGLDNDCNGVVDDGNPGGGGVCGSNVGECRPGLEKCIAGKLQCSGAKVEGPEVCDCLDNDCDGKVDEQPTTGEAALCPGGNSECAMCQCAQPCRNTGEFSVNCPSGKTGVTVNGQCLCVGERCNDAACGDETLTSGNSVLCTPGSKTIGTCVCKSNQCVARCDGVVCSGGLICDSMDGLCKERSCLLPQFACKSDEYCDIAKLDCVADTCATKTCDKNQACRDGACFASCATQTCAANQLCHDGVCEQDRCHDVTCPGGQDVCDPSTGSCVPAGMCVNTGCKDGYMCNSISGVCEPDRCLRTNCPKGQVCHEGECEIRCSSPLLDCDDTCVNPSSSREHCGATSDCQGGNAGKACSGGQVCSEGECTSSCKEGLLNCAGGCVDPDTDRLHCGASGLCQGALAGSVCETGMLCKGGVCLTQTSGSTPGSLPPELQKRISVTGGGGCACSVPSGQRGRELPPSGSILLLGLGLLRRRWRLLCARYAAGLLRGVLALGSLLAALLFGGCHANTFCLNCTDDDAGKITGPGGGFSNPDATVTLPTDSGQHVTPDAAMSQVDASVRPDAGSGCVDSEVCNGLDDDCDGKVDEGADAVTLGIDTQTDAKNCGVCGHKCVLDHAFSKCSAGACQIDMCDPEYTDLDGKPATGCEYRCTKVADEDKVCDHRDDDCDQLIDDEVDFKTDHANCGSCGNTCSPANATGGGYCDQGECKLDSTKCDSGFVDADGVYANGCEYQCKRSDDGFEVCNSADDDCDRRVDEGVAATDPRIGAACGSSAGVCVAGVQACGSGGVIICNGSQGPITEVCNGVDDDCDGNVDESFPQRGLPCGTDSGECVRGNQQCLNGGLVCVGGTGPQAEQCDGKDNDCDTRTDETNQTDGPPVGVGQTCKTVAGGALSLSPPPVIGNCNLGVAQCSSGRLLCVGEVGPQPELCDAVDQDCDGDPLNGVTMTDPLIGSSCGTDVGECKFGVYKCNAGMRQCDNSGGKLPVAEVCNGKDDDCDGSYDETDPVTHVKPVGAGENCRRDALGAVHSGPSESVQGECRLGTSVCSGGVVACPDYVGPTPEQCDNLDQDCDGNSNNGVASTDARIGQPCAGNNVGVCRSGSSYCNAGTLACQGVVTASTELCDGLDNNCNGSLADDGAAEPTLNTVCGTAGGICRTGTRTCLGGAMQCSGQVTAQPEVCDSIPSDPNNPIYDNDCDGKVDEDFQLLSNVNRCGGCNTVCAFAHATPQCVNGVCQIASCAPGYHNSVSTPGPDCNVGPCTVAGNEICNGVDDDCNGLVDDGLSVPAGVCNTIGACAGAVATCQGVSGWVCSKLPSTEKCNTFDDNCNGQTDEGFAVNQSCAAAGVGACATPGTLQCNGAGTATVCANGGGVPVTTGSPTSEICNGVDDDCDGTVDEPCPSADSNCVTDSWVSLGGGIEIYKYEASRPDANASTAGSKTSRACSVANRLPWANLTYLEARAACDAADPTARLCTEGEWEQACMNDAGGTCNWGFPDHPACNTWVFDQCNGIDYNSTPAIQASGHSGARDGCYRGPSSTPAQQIFELSGNVKEYVLQRDTGAIPVRGGATNNTQDGMRCDFDFPVWPNNSSFSNVGFRCCRSATALPIQCAVFQNTGINVTDAVLATNAIDVGMTGVITDVNVVNFTGTHNTMSQIDYMELVGPDATTVRLTNSAYCGNNDNWSYVFDQEAASSLPPSNTSPCGNGTTYKGFQSLANFYGKNPYGTWTIRVHDNSSSGSSSSPHINSWGVRVCINPN